MMVLVTMVSMMVGMIFLSFLLEVVSIMYLCGKEENEALHKKVEKLKEEMNLLENSRI